MFVTTYIYMVTWIRTSEIAAKRIRERYLKSILRQDVAFFDNVGAGEVATRIQTDTHLVQLGISEKVPVATSFIGAFFTGFICTSSLLLTSHLFYNLFLTFIFDFMISGLRSMLATRIGLFRHPPLYRHHWCPHEHLHVQIQTRPTLPRR
jgi:ABC-type multidrug transport system fused ATPase/permease subunit